MDRNGLSGEKQERLDLSDHDDSGGVHDGCLHDLHLCGEDRPWAAELVEPRDRAHHVCGLAGRVLRFVLQAQEVVAGMSSVPLRPENCINEYEEINSVMMTSRL